MSHKIENYNSVEEELLSDARVKLSAVRDKYFRRYKSFLEDQTAHELEQVYQLKYDSKTVYTKGSLEEMKGLQQSSEYKNVSNTLENSFIADLVQDAADLSDFLKTSSKKEHL